jgi:hypothetical protein
MEGIHKIASQIDIGFILAEATGDILNHTIVVDEKNSVIDIYCIPKNSLKKIKYNLRIPHDKKSS